MKDKRKPSLVFVISGPSGSGKTSVVRELFKYKEFRKKFSRSVSFTTRPRRTCERNGKDYFFVGEERFKDLIRSKKILEWTRYLGYYYGTSRDFIDGKLAKGRHVILCLDLKGALSLKRKYPGRTVTFFIAPPSFGELEKRITGRCARTRKEEIKNRLKLARKEVKSAQDYDYRIENKELSKAKTELKKIILRKT